MKYCTYCGEPMEDEAVFCTHCGKKFEGAETIINEQDTISNESAESIQDSNVAPVVNDDTEASGQQESFASDNIPYAQDVQIVSDNGSSASLKAPGKSIASLILGISSVVSAFFGLLFAFCSLIPYAGAALMSYGISFGIIAIGTGIPASVLAKKAERIGDYNSKEKLGKIFGRIGFIVGICAFVFAIIFGCISIASYGYYY